MVTHNLGTQAVVTALYSNGNKVEHNTLVTSNNAITVTFKASSAVTAGDYKIVVLASGGSGGGSADDTYTANVKNYTVVGILTENNGVLSGFTANTNYASTSNTYQLGSNIELCVKFKTSNDITEGQIIIASNDVPAFAIILTGGLFKYNISRGEYPWDSFMGTYSVQPNTEYYVKIIYNGVNYKGYVSVDGAIYTQDMSTTYTGSLLDCKLNIGVGNTLAAPFLGSIDLKGTYLNINGTKVWTGADIAIKSQNNRLFYDIAQKQYIDSIYSSTGSALMWGVDEANERMVLPRTNFYDNAGKLYFVV